MPLTEIDFSGTAQPIDGYAPGAFRIGGRVLHGAVLVTPTGAGPWAGMEDPAALPAALAGQVDVLFVGTGAAMAPLPPAFRTALEEAGIGVEPMATPAACRTYNICLSEGRRIAAALIPV